MKTHPTITHYLMYSDNWDGAVVTKACYLELRLQMSSGDFGTHLAIGLNWNDAMRLVDKMGQKYIYHVDAENGEVCHE